MVKIPLLEELEKIFDFKNILKNVSNRDNILIKIGGDKIEINNFTLVISPKSYESLPEEKKGCVESRCVFCAYVVGDQFG